MSDKRAKSIAQRKQRILDAARAIIARDGIEGLTTRGLAEAAGVTVPTLYNLIGDKQAIVAAMATDAVEQVWDRLEFDRRATPLEMADAVIDEAFAEIQSDPDFTRSAMLGLASLGTPFAYRPGCDDPGAYNARRSVDMAEFACRAAQRLGQLRGNVPSRELAIQMFATYRAALDDWMHGAIDENEMLRRQRAGFYMVLAADASDEFREELLTRIATLSPSPAEREAA